MGAYLSEPITDKISSDEANERLAWGTSSMQGWRISQEDAHNCVTEYDESTSYFAVYDGHGGSEVATYCSQKLPDFIKQSEAYKNGDLSQALIDGYLGFDATIVTKDVIKILKELAGNKQGEEAMEEEEEEDDNVLSLKKEAHMPLEEVMAKYQDKGMIFRLVRDSKGNPLSPFLKGKSRKKKDDAAGSSGDTLVSGCANKSELNDDVSSSTSDGCKTHPGGDAQVSTSNGDTDAAKADSGGSKSTDETLALSSSKATTTSLLPDSSNDNCSNLATSGDSTKEPETKENIADSNAGPTTSDDHKNVTESKPSNKTSELSKCNGDVTESTKSTDGNVSSSSQEKERKSDSKGKGKAKAAVSSSESPQKVNSEEGNTFERTKRAAALYNNLLNTEEEDDDSDSNDENFEGQEEQSSSDENEVNGVENGSSGDDDNDENEEEEESSDEEEDEEEEYDETDLTGSDEPGMDSGCTAVVAVLKGKQLYVANAGDSRCIVCRDGQAIDMSIDHKPEDPLELARVEKAGGKVNGDGRINGGLNLSRAIGDHSYKQNKELDDKEQMITALPDIKTLDIDSEKDQFMVLACDGIWNYMTSQEVVDFVAERISDESKNLSQICEELFCKCLAPSTVGDGTGCDNMTAIIVKFKNNLPAATSAPQESTKKRPADNEEEPDETSAKRHKTEDKAVMSAAVTSSE